MKILAREVSKVVRESTLGTLVATSRQEELAQFFGSKGLAMAEGGPTTLIHPTHWAVGSHSFVSTLVHSVELVLLFVERLSARRTLAEWTLVLHVVMAAETASTLHSSSLEATWTILVATSLIILLSKGSVVLSLESTSLMTASLMMLVETPASLLVERSSVVLVVVPLVFAIVHRRRVTAALHEVVFFACPVHGTWEFVGFRNYLTLITKSLTLQVLLNDLLGGVVAPLTVAARGPIWLLGGSVLIV